MSLVPIRVSVEEDEDSDLPVDLPPPPPLQRSSSRIQGEDGASLKTVPSSSVANLPPPPPALDRSRSSSIGGLSMSSPVIGRVQKLGLRPLENGDESARLFLVDGVEVTMPMSAVACPICFAKFDEEGAPIPEGQKKLLHLKVKCTTCLKMVCSSCSKLVRLESYGETESRKICFPCLEDVKKKIGHFKTAGRGSGRAAPPEADRKAVSGPWSPATGRGMTRRASVGGRGEGRGRGSGFSSPGGGSSEASLGASSPVL